MANVGGCHVTLSVVFANAASKAKMERAILAIADTVGDNPWLGLDGAVEELIEAFEELAAVEDK